jgi:DNA-binding protein HU-beta
MNKTELIGAIAKGADISKVAAARALDSFIKAITDSLSKGTRVALPGFGAFDVGKRKKRTGRNPRTGEPMVIPAAKVPRFRAGKNLKEKVNK